MKAHCLTCGKEYTYWAWIHHHYIKEHPENHTIIRVKEIWDVMNAEAEMVINTPLSRWI